MKFLFLGNSNRSVIIIRTRQSGLKKYPKAKTQSFQLSAIMSKASTWVIRCPFHCFEGLIMQRVRVPGEIGGLLVGGWGRKRMDSGETVWAFHQENIRTGVPVDSPLFRRIRNVAKNNQEPREPGVKQKKKNNQRESTAPCSKFRRNPGTRWEYFDTKILCLKNDCGYFDIYDSMETRYIRIKTNVCFFFLPQPGSAIFFRTFYTIPNYWEAVLLVW